MSALERAERAKARALKCAVEQLAEESNLPVADVEAELARYRLVAAEAARLHPGDSDRLVAFVAQQIGVDKEELRAEMERTAIALAGGRRTVREYGRRNRP